MHRTAKHGLLMLLMLIVGLPLLIALGLVLIGTFPDYLLPILALTGISLFIPGRVLGYYWSAYFDGQKLQSKGKYLEAIPRYERFLKTIKERPVLKKLIWLSDWMYTRDAEVLTLSNIGVAYLRLNNLDQAEAHLKAAAELDPQSPLPYYNLSVIYHAQGDAARGDENLAKAESLGYSRSSIRQLVRVTREATAPGEGTKAAP